MHAHCTEKWESQSLYHVQCDNELLNDTIKAHCSHTIITELLTCDVQPVNQHWPVIYVVIVAGQKKRDLTWNQITFTSTLIRHSLSGSVHASSWPVSAWQKSCLMVSASRHRPSSRVLAWRMMPSWHSRRTWSRLQHAVCFYQLRANCGPSDQLLLQTVL